MKFWGTEQVVFDACGLDTSAIVEVGLRATHCEVVVTQMERMGDLAVGAPSLVEAALVLQQRFGYDPRPWLEGFVRNSRLEVIPFEYEHYHLAAEAFLLYGKGRHPARLNLGDCLSYAGAKVAGRPLLYIGEDFARTEVASVLPGPLV